MHGEHHNVTGCAANRHDGTGITSRWAAGLVLAIGQ
jgi:hypothetical protein